MQASEVPQGCQIEICEERNPALVVPRSPSLSVDGFSIYQLKIGFRDGSIADSDIRDVDLDYAAVTAHSQVIEVSVHQGSVEVPPAIDAGQAPTMDNVIPAPLCATLITCTAYGLYILLFTSKSAAAPLLVTGPSFPPRRQGPISMLPGTPVAFSGASVALPAPHSAAIAMQSAGAPQGTALQPVASRLWPNQPTPYASAFMAPPAWPMYMPSYMPRTPTQQAFMQADLKSLPGSAKT